MIASLKSLWRKENGTLAALNGLGLIGSIIYIPHLARALGPVGWGQVSIVMAASAICGVIVNFAFDVTGLREVRQLSCSDAVANAKKIHAILMAQILIGAFLILLTALVVFSQSDLHQYRHFIAPSLLLGIAQGMSLRWLLQAFNGHSYAAAAAALGQWATCAGLVSLVNPGSSEMVAVYVIAAGVIMTWGLMALRIRHVLFVPSKIAVKDALYAIRYAWAYFRVRAAVTILGLASPLVIAGLSSPAEVGYYSIALKISGALWILVYTLVSLAAPQAASAWRGNGSRAYAMSLIYTKRIVSRSLVAALGAIVLSYPMITMVFGSNFDGAVGPFCIVIIVFPFSALNTSFDLLWLNPIRKEGKVLMPCVLCGLINIVAAIILIPRLGAVGAAGSLLLSEVLKCVLLYRITTKEIRVYADRMVNTLQSG